MSSLRVGSLALLLTLLPFTALAYFPGYVPLDPALLERRFPQELVTAHCERPDFSLELKSVGKGGARLHATAGRAVLDGTTTEGRRWEVVLGRMHFGCEAWSGDFDQNGAQDLVFMIPTAAVGIAPGQELLFVMFDEAGLPIPWHIVGYFGSDEAGLEDLLDIDPSQRAVLVEMELAQVRSIVPPRSYHSYWGTTAYMPSAGQWNRVASVSGLRFPLFTRFTQRPNRATVTPPAVTLFDYSRGLAKTAHALRVTSEGKLRLADGETCDFRGATVVFDTHDGVEAFGSPDRLDDDEYAAVRKRLRKLDRAAISREGDEPFSDCTFLHATETTPR